MLDTNFCIDLMRGRLPAAFERLTDLEPGQTLVSSITVAELWYGAAKSTRRQLNESQILTFCAPLKLESFDVAAADKYGRVRALLEASGTPIGTMDMLIAAHALSRGATLITANLKEFERVAGLSVENWRH